MYYLRNFFVQSTIALSLVTMASSVATAGSILVTSAVTGSTGAYVYNYTVTNTTPDDPLVIDIPVPKLPGAVTNLVAPAGFQSAFDSGLGFVSFLEDSASFGPTPVTGFSFKSPYAAGAVTFQASTLIAATGAIVTVAGATSAPIAASATPEPGYFGLLSLALAVGAFVKFRPLVRS